MKCAILRTRTHEIPLNDLKGVGCDKVDFFEIREDAEESLYAIVANGYRKLFIDFLDACVITKAISEGLEVYLLEFVDDKYIGLSKILNIKILKEPITRYAGLRGGFMGTD